MIYAQLDINKIIETINSLILRIQDRFPNSGLLSVCMDLEKLSLKSKENISKIRKPYIYFRIAFYSIIILALFSIIISIKIITETINWNNVNDIITIGDSLLNEIVAIGAAFFFLYKLEETVKQKIILNALHELRSIAHVIDMHQLSKDPTTLVIEKTIHSPKRDLTPYQLNRYLEYCSEMLAICSKIAAVYANNNRNDLVLENIQDIEILTSSLARKIWNKISLITTYEKK